MISNQSEPGRQEFAWWQRGIVYQIYPRSFGDSNGDGVGDLNGVLEHLDYLVWLGVDALWLSPIYPSPMADFGYDISNYTDIDPLFGDLAAFDRLVAQAHERNLKVIMDFVPNHTSDEHPWFVEARASRNNPQRDWYIWHDGHSNNSSNNDDRNESISHSPLPLPPNNWLSAFGGSAWSWDEASNQYYLHSFLKEQPDLNWRNPQVREAMYGVMRFWFDRGVDGLRVDVLPQLIKDEALRDNPLNPAWQPGDPWWTQYLRTYSQDQQPEIHEVVREMRKLCEEYSGQNSQAFVSERMLIGETYLPLPQLIRYYGNKVRVADTDTDTAAEADIGGAVKLDGVHLPFNFGFLLLENWSANTVKSLVDTYEASLPSGAWPNWVLGNHDRSRLVSRVGAAQARVGQMLLLTLRGTPTLYYGDELGMHDGIIPPELAHDPQGKIAPEYSRDPVRTPMQWDVTANAGFSRQSNRSSNIVAIPWLPLPNDYLEQNVEIEKTDPTSFLKLVRTLIQLRRKLSALSIGQYIPLQSENQQVLAYLRQHKKQKVLILLNFSSVVQTVSLSHLEELGDFDEPARRTIECCSTYLDYSTLSDKNTTVTNQSTFLSLRANEGLLIILAE